MYFELIERIEKIEEARPNEGKVPAVGIGEIVIEDTNMTKRIDDLE